MKKLIYLICILFFVIIIDAKGSPAPHSVIISFIGDAQTSGRIKVKIYFTNGDSCITVSHSRFIGGGEGIGDQAIRKAQEIVEDINTQCGGSVKAEYDHLGTFIIKDSLKTMLGGRIEDSTNQIITINPTGFTNASIQFSGEGTCATGSAFVSLDNCGSSSTTSIYGKSGYQVCVDLVAGLTNCEATYGTNITAVDLGGGIGEIRFVNLPDSISQIRFSDAGDCGLNESFSFDNNTTSVPTFSEWGLIIFGLMLLTLGILILRRKQRLAI